MPSRVTRYPIINGKRLRLERNHGRSWSVYSRNWVYWLGTVDLYRGEWFARDFNSILVGRFPTRIDAVRRLAENLPDSAQ